MGRLVRTHWSPRSARALPALLLALLGVLLLPPPAHGATTYKVLYAFPLTLPPLPSPVDPSGLFRDATGNLYGTTWFGGDNDQGAVFKLTPPAGSPDIYTFSLVSSFPAVGADGLYPAATAGLILGGDGNFYGTTYNGGGSDDLGTVFKLTTAGTLTTLHAFTVAGSDGAYPAVGLHWGTDGNLYGTTSDKGTPGYGTVFKLTPTGSFTTIHPFVGAADGENPFGGVLRDSDGNLYGTTSSGGSSTYGTVFKLTPSGETFTLTTLHSFTGTAGQGANPQGTLVRDPDGTLYGTTYSGGASTLGTVFKLSPTGTLTTLHAFSGIDGAYPYAGLLRGADGNLYGTTLGSCMYGDVGCTSGSGTGTVFRLATDGSAFTTLHTFNGTNGANPKTNLIQGNDGYFYGTTSLGGSTAGGVVFVLRVGNTLTVTPAAHGTVTSAPAGISCPPDATACLEVFPVGSLVTLTATPATGWTFTGWGGSSPDPSGGDLNCPGTGTCTVTMDRAWDVTATFKLQLTVSKPGTGTGTVTSDLPGIDCGTTCTATFDYNTKVTLTAAPTGTSLFTGWSGAGCSGTGPCVVTLTQAQTVTATFAPPTVPLTVKVAGSSGGTVSNTPFGLSCTTSCTVDVNVGVTVTVTVTAGPGGTFKGWRDACTGTAPTCVVTPGTATTVTAVFSKTFTDSTLTVGSTPVRVVHITDLRAAIDTLRSHYPGLGAFAWTDPTPTLTAGSTPVKRQHLLDLRTALDAAYTAAGKTHTAYTDATITAGTTPIRAIHLTELRSFVQGLE